MILHIQYSHTIIRKEKYDCFDCASCKYASIQHRTNSHIVNIMLGKMEQSPVDPIFTLEEVAAQEETYVLDYFTQREAKLLGDIMFQINEDYNMNFAFEIYLNGVTVYKFLPEGTGKLNSDWMAHKINTVMTVGYSTMKYWILSAGIGGERAKDFYPTGPIVACGGGFPIRVKGAGVIGAIACSGPGDQNDHLFCVEALKRLKEKLN